MKRKILLDGYTIEYELVRKNVKNINLRIHPDMSIHISANRNVTIDIVEKLMLDKKDFILNALQKYKDINARQAPPLQFTNGEHFRFFEKDYIINVNKSDVNHIMICGDSFNIYVCNINDYELKRRTVDTFIKNEFIKIIDKYCNEAYDKFKVYGIAYPQIKLKNMKSRWGSCNFVKGIVTFNTRLYEYPVECTEMVVYHEFTHFLQHDHSAKFYEKLSCFVPDWKERNKILNSKR